MSKPMTKTQLVAALAEAMGSDKKTANAALDCHRRRRHQRGCRRAAPSPFRVWARSFAAPAPSVRSATRPPASR